MNNIDLFSKKIELYYQGKSKKSFLIGCLFTISYISVFIAFIIYKLIRIAKKVDAKFYDTYANIGEAPSIKLSKDNFYGGFALENPETYDTFIDETIYYPKAYFKKAERNGNKWSWTSKEIELERCKLEKFGDFYKEKFKGKALNNLYCFKDMNETLTGHFSYDKYTLFYISFHPCTNTSENNNHCKPIEYIDYFLKGTFISFEMQDIELTPQIYDSPISPRDKNFYATVGKKIFQEIHILFQIVNIETDLDYLGFDDFKNIKTEKYLKYESSLIMSNIIENNIYETGESFCNITIKLSDKVLTQKRTYTKLLEILGNVGGLMEVLFSLFKLISSFSSKILYEISLVNNLFEFNIDKKIISIKEINNDYKRKVFPSNEKLNIYVPIKPIIKTSSKNSKEAENSPQNYQLNEDILNKNKITIENLVKSKKPNENTIKSINFSNIKTLENNYANNKILMKKKYKNSNFKKNQDKSEINIFNINMNNINYNKKDGIENGNENALYQIKTNYAFIYFCFCCARKRKNMQNILLDEGLKIIKKKLDILNLFKKIYKEEQNQENINKLNTIKMSDKCKRKLKLLYNSLNFE